MAVNPLIRFTAMEIQDCLAFTSDLTKDSRGSLTRIWEDNTVLAEFTISEASVANNPISGTLRGLHFQTEPYPENKFIQCVSGKAFDVVFDVRKESDTYRKHVTLEIGPNCEFQGLFVPKGCAHGYLTLEPNTSLIYFMDNQYSITHSPGIRWDDAALSINWPDKPKIISSKDSSWPVFRDA
jgi:dTDP-4-dehydrorhamnose 3,5-epimerase